MIGSRAPICDREHITFVGHPFTSQAGTEQNVIDPAESVLLSKVMGPIDPAQIGSGMRVRDCVAIPLGGTRIDELMPAPSYYCFG